MHLKDNSPHSTLQINVPINSQHSKRAARIFHLLGLPTYLFSIFLAFGFNALKFWWLFCFWLVGWILYAALFRILQKRYILNKEPRELLKFYFLLIGIQFIPICVTALFIAFKQ